MGGSGWPRGRLIPDNNPPTTHPHHISSLTHYELTNDYQCRSGGPRGADNPTAGNIFRSSISLPSRFRNKQEREGGLSQWDSLTYSLVCMHVRTRGGVGKHWRGGHQNITYNTTVGAA